MSRCWSLPFENNSSAKFPIQSAVCSSSLDFLSFQRRMLQDTVTKSYYIMVYYIHCSSFICIITHFHKEGNHICQSWFALRKSIWLLLIIFLTFMGLDMECKKMCKSWAIHTEGSVQWPHQGFRWGWSSSFSLPPSTLQRRKQQSLFNRKISWATWIFTQKNSLTITLANCSITLWIAFGFVDLNTSSCSKSTACHSPTGCPFPSQNRKFTYHSIHPTGEALAIHTALLERNLSNSWLPQTRVAPSTLTASIWITEVMTAQSEWLPKSSSCRVKSTFTLSFLLWEALWSLVYVHWRPPATALPCVRVQSQSAVLLVT